MTDSNESAGDRREPSRPALVCVHGWGVNAGIWDGLSRAAGEQLSLHAPDLPGHGSNAPEAGGATPGLEAGLNNWTDAVVERAPAQAVYLGWSLGGLIAMQAALRHPQRVRGLILVNTLPRMLRSADWPWGMRASAVAETARGLRADYVTTLQEFLMLQILGEPGARHLVRQMRSQLLSRPPQLEGLERGLDILEEADLRPRLGEIRVPVLIVHGERDRMCHPDGARWTADQLPDAELWSVARAAHAPFLSHEREFARRVVQFAQACGAAAR